MSFLREVTWIESGEPHGPITRLIGPSDLGEHLKPFIFLDYLNAHIAPGMGFPMHPHSGIATLTWQPDTDVAYQDTTGQQGTLKAGGLEWMNAGGGAWHQASLLTAGQATGFQLWVAMPPGVENGPAEGQYIPPEDVPVMNIPGGTVKVLLGNLQIDQVTASSPILSHQDMNYLVVQLDAGASWTYSPPPTHGVAFAVGFSCSPRVNEIVLQDRLLVLSSEGDIQISAPSAPAKVLVGTAVRHDHKLVLGTSSVHTSDAALAAGIKSIRRIGAELHRAGQLTPL